MNISFNGFGDNTVTFEADTSLTCAGVPVTITQQGKAALCEEGDTICGVAVNVRGGYAAVQLKGYVELPVSGDCGYGFVKLVAAADGKVKVSDSGNPVLVVSADADTVGFIL